MKKLIVLNHKMNLEYDEIFPYIEKINKINTTNNLVVCPSSIYLNDFVNYCNWGVGSQDVSYEKSGNYTGEISTLQLKSIGVEYSIIGHYERKRYFKETNSVINNKLIACLESNIIPILCFGETGDINDTLNNLKELLKNINNIDFIVFAYEPLKVDTNLSLEKINEDINTIYDYLYDLYESKPNIIYGGGVTKKDINKLLASDKINGLLIGSISSNIEKINSVIKAID
jgi:triosephosphate isomerase